MTRSLPVLITGATGFVGSHFAYRLLRCGGSVIALVRGASSESARARLVRVLDDVATSYGEGALDAVTLARLGVVTGDVTEPCCGLASDAVASLRGRVASVWHFAASLAYQEHAAIEIARHNVEGVESVLACARAVAARRFVYVSTAYTAGRQTGRIAEELPPEGTVFNNVYERTKAEAERRVLAALAGSGVEVRILRPSIVIGPSTTHDVGGSETGIYGFLRALRRARRSLNAGSAIHTVDGDPDLELNLIPVDHVVEGMLRVHDGACPARVILHLTNPEGPRLGAAIALGCELVGVRPIRLVPGHAPTTVIEKALLARFDFYASYFRDGKSFARSLPSDLRLSSMDAVRPYVVRALERDTSTAVVAARAAG